MRINQFIASCGVASRRKAEDLIKQGLITVNGEVCKDLSTNITETDIVEYNGRSLRLQENKVYIMLNKPKGYLTSVSDDRGRPTVLNLITGVKERIFPVGRLDYNTEGLLLLTNDGEFTNKITHPKKHISKTYEVVLKTKPTNEALQTLRNGVLLDGVKTQPAIISRPKNCDGLYVLNMTIFEGKNRQIRRMFESVGYKVYSLKRLSIGKLELSDLPLKKYKFLTENEIELIFR